MSLFVQNAAKGLLVGYLFEVGGGGKRGREDLLRSHIQTERVKLGLVPLARLGRVVRHEKALLPGRPQLV